MRDIPEVIKIHGKRVTCQASGRGYVCVGESFEEMTDEVKAKLEEAYKGDKQLAAEQWNAEMCRLFDLACVKERKRMKALKSHS